MTSFYELEGMLQEFIEAQGFRLHQSLFTAYGAEGTYRYKLIISKNQSSKPKVNDNDK